MAFWIILGLAVLVSIIVAVYYLREWDEFPIGSIAAVWLVAAVVGLFVIIPGSRTGVTDPAEVFERHDLRALVTKDSEESEFKATFFLGFGSASGSSGTVTSIAYIQRAEDGGSTLERVDIDESVIYEDVQEGEQPYVEDWMIVHHSNTWFWPWPFEWADWAGDSTHRFHIPAGTILENYEVTP